MPQLNKLFCFLPLAFSASAALIGRDRTSDLQRRVQAGDANDYTQVFPGTGTDPSARDASVSGGGYLGFKTVPDLPTCLHKCDLAQNCVFVNLYSEYNEPNDPQPHIKCALYSQVHTAADKTNFGGQLLDPALGKTYIQDSSGWSLDIPPDPATPAGYELTFGPVNALISAMDAVDSENIPTYDVQHCADLCTNIPACKFYNIFRFSDGVPTTPRCNFFATVHGSEALVASGSGFTVRFSRGYEKL